MDTRNDVTRAALPISPEKTVADRQEIQRLAQQFEAMLMTQMLREMRRSMLDEQGEQEEQEDGFGAGAMTDTADIALATALSAQGGVGLTDSLLKAFERQIAPDARARAAGAFVGPTVVGTATPIALGSADAGASFRPNAIVREASVSSPFGWRRDPLTGTPRMHQGLDMAVAYGQDVRAAAAGVVAFAGVQGDYGTTVVVDHGGGRQTRYAHLSEALVPAGRTVAEGEVLGRSGSSGRSLGPHLHFELLQDGQAVDPLHTVSA